MKRMQESQKLPTISVSILRNILIDAKSAFADYKVPSFVSESKSMYITQSAQATWIAKQQRGFDRYAPPLPAAECISGEGYRYC
jgi:hypothetical protein